jgi:hypothetical protein
LSAWKGPAAFWPASISNNPVLISQEAVFNARCYDKAGLQFYSTLIFTLQNSN